MYVFIQGKITTCKFAVPAWYYYIHTSPVGQNPENRVKKFHTVKERFRDIVSFRLDRSSDKTREVTYTVQVWPEWTPFYSLASNWSSDTAVYRDRRSFDVLAGTETSLCSG